MLDDSANISSDEAILVEYLDGELSEHDRRHIEERLASEPVLREMLARLEESWQYLDLLEYADTDKALLETTLETVAVSAEQALIDLETKNRRRFSWRKILGGLAAVLLFFVALRLGTVSAPDKTFLLRIATPIIDRLDLYLLIVDEDREFLRLMTEHRIFLPALPPGKTVDPQDYLPVSSARIMDVFSVRPSAWELRRRVERIEHLDAVYYNQFYKNHERLKAMSWKRQNQLRELHEDIERSPGRYELLQTLQNYYAWQKALQQYERNELRQQQSLPLEQRVERIIAMRAKQNIAHPDVFDPAPVISLLKDADEENEDESAQKLARTLEHLDLMARDQVLNAPPRQALNRLIEMSQWADTNDKNEQ